jgi:hypothetical protein
LPREKRISSALHQDATAGGGIQYKDETHETLAQRVEWLRQVAGDRFDQLELGLLVWAVAITDDRQAAADAIVARALRPVGTADHIPASPYYLIGTVDAIVDQLVEPEANGHLIYLSISFRYQSVRASRCSASQHVDIAGCGRLSMGWGTALVPQAGS